MTSLSSPRRLELRQPTTAHAAEIGLVGSAGELAMGACLVQAFGKSALSATERRFKEFPQIQFRALVRNGVPESGFLTTGVPDPDQHRHNLL